MKNVDVRKKTKLTDELTFSLQRKWKWAGHVASYNDDRWTKRSVTWTGPRGTRARGRPSGMGRLNSSDSGSEMASHSYEWRLVECLGGGFYSKGVHTRITIYNYNT
ncbi:jg9623 [Pararge aegeria aegeria]|uniref:Jg9623 protein n=1 Tax=Pararge aegeria aegeria TaxID=348720 RepID=A0A8S4RVE5_9NEOP|nr:jg9623 [Pararge aegeria aegeria]